MTIKITKMALVNMYMYLTIGGVKIRVLSYTPEILSLWLHFPYIIMALEGGNSTEAR